MSERLERYVHATFRDYYTFLPGNCTNFTSFKYLLKHTNTNTTMIVSGKELMKLSSDGDTSSCTANTGSNVFQLPGGKDFWDKEFKSYKLPVDTPCTMIGNQNTYTLGWPGMYAGPPGEPPNQKDIMNCKNYFEYILDSNGNPTTQSKSCLGKDNPRGEPREGQACYSNPKNDGICDNSGIKTIPIVTPAPSPPPTLYRCIPGNGCMPDVPYATMTKAECEEWCK